VLHHALPSPRGLLLALASLLVAPVIHAEPATRVFLNGVPTPVYFNDGDSFRVLAGPLEGTKARLSGYNTLESFGPVHSWGGWNAYELYAIAKKATMNARQGTWRCTSDMSRDGYGRMLWHCPGLALDQISKGLAHAMSVTTEPADRELLEAQWRAQARGVGMWAKGVPEYVLTSLHSLEEDPEKPTAYNRAVSPLDGHSQPWVHTDTYEECSKVCLESRRVSAATVEKLAAELTAEPALAKGLGPFTTVQMGLVLSDFIREGRVSGVVPDAIRAGLEKRLTELKAQGALAPVETTKDACHVYVAFKRRFGLQRAACLADH
jgi:endonuclease YncB( thermonuclease family)